MRYIFILVGLAIALAPHARAQSAPDTPEDKPPSIGQQQAAAFEAAIAPYVADARRTYPAAKQRYRDGLPEGQTFYLTTRLRDPEGNREQAIILVQEIHEQRVTGIIVSEVQLVSGYKFGQPYSFHETEMIDWLITKPDGSEEGNVVGKFLDTYQP